MARTKPVPIFTPWDGQAMTIRHHEHHERIAKISYAETDPAEPECLTGWVLCWAWNRLPVTIHDTALEAVAHARDAYPEYLKAENEATRGFREREKYEERFVRRRANSVARALRVPTGGQKGWQNRRPSAPDAEQ